MSDSENKIEEPQPAEEAPKESSGEDKPWEKEGFETDDLFTGSEFRDPDNPENETDTEDLDKKLDMFYEENNRVDSLSTDHETEGMPKDMFWEKVPWFKYKLPPGETIDDWVHADDSDTSERQDKANLTDRIA